MLKLNQLLTRKQAGDRIKFRILIPLVLALGVLLAAFAFAIWRVQQKDQARAADLSAREVERWLLAGENEKTAVMKTTIEALMNDGQLTGAFRQRDRAALLERAKPLFDSLRSEHSITHFYFHLPDRTVWLRMHDPGSNGDKIDRHTMLEAERTGKISVGYERGLTGIFTLRVVSPWRQDGQLLGYLELGVEFENMVQDIHKKVNEDVDFVVAVDKKLIDREQWAAVMKREGWTDDWNRFPRLVVIGKTVETLPKLAVDYLLTENPRPKSSRQGGNFQLVFLPLTDVAGEDHGKLIVLQNGAEQMAVTSGSIRFVVALSLAVGTVVISFFYFFLTGVEKDLSDRTAKLKNEITERKGVEERIEWLSRFPSENPNPVLRVSAQGVLEYANAASDILLRTMGAEVGGAVNAEWQARIGETLAKEHSINIEFQAGDRTFSVTLSPVVNRGYVNLYVSDITERKRAEDALRQSEEQFRAMFEMASVGIAQADPRTGRWLLVNQKMCAITGYSAAELLQMRVPEITHPEDREKDWEKFERVVRGESPNYRLEKRYIRKDGALAWVNVNMTIIRDAAGQPTRTMATIEDITARKRAEESLRESEVRYRALFDGNADGILVAELETRTFKYANPALCRMLGYTEDELRTMGVPDIHPKDAVQSVVAEFEAQARGVKKLAMDIPCLRKDGSVFHADVNAVKITIDGKPCNVGFFRDITERKRAQAELENVHKQLLDASRRGGMAEIATNVLHNVGNVLNSVNISTGLIVESVKKSRISSLARVVVLLREHAHDLGAFITTDPKGKHVPAHLAQLSEHLLADQESIASELSSLRRNVEHIKEIVVMQQNYATVGGVKELINMVTLVEDSLIMNEGALSRHHVEVIREFENVPPMNVEKHKILQILVNLERNAQQACDESERADKRLTVRVTDGDGRVKISVIDNGVGIPPENLTRIFNYGFTTRKGGHGFGLHSGALAAREMGGSLTVHSDGPGQGAAFTLELPCDPGKTNS